MPDTRGLPILRPDATPDQIAEARAFARAELLAPAAFMESVGEVADYSGFTEAQKANFAHAWDVTRPALDILAVSGSGDDAQYLADVVASLGNSPMVTALAAEFATASVQISLRLGDVAGSPAALAWHGLGSLENPVAWASLGVALGNVGYRPAITGLIQHLAIERMPLPTSASHDALQIITMEEHPEVLKLAVDLIAAASEYQKAGLTGAAAERHLVGINVVTAFDTAFGYAAAYLPDPDRKALSVGISAAMEVNGGYFEAPAELAALAVGITSGEYGGMGTGPIMYLACRVYGNVPGDRRAAAEQRYHEVLTELATRFGNAYPEVDARAYGAVGKSRCSVNSAAIKLLMSPQDNSPEFFPAWMQHALRDPSHFLPNFDEYAEAPLSLTGVLSGYEDAALEILDNAELSGRHGVEAYRYYRSVIDSSGLGTFDMFPGDTDERFFVEPLEVPTVSPLYLAAQVGLTPRLTDNRLLFGITMDLAQGDLGGLAGMINQSGEKMQALTANSGLPLIDKVVLRTANEESQLEYVQTTSGGTHVFELTEKLSSNANLYVDIYFQGVDRRWRQSFPLYASPIGYTQIRETGRIHLADQFKDGASR